MRTVKDRLQAIEDRIGGTDESRLRGLRAREIVGEVLARRDGEAYAILEQVCDAVEAGEPEDGPAIAELCRRFDERMIAARSGRIA